MQAVLQVSGGRHLTAPCLPAALPLFLPLFVHLNRGWHSSLIQTSTSIMVFVSGCVYDWLSVLLVSVLLLRHPQSLAVQLIGGGSSSVLHPPRHRSTVPAAAEVEVAA